MWNPQDPFSMATFIWDNGMPLNKDEESLVERAGDLETAGLWSVQDLHELNVLCWMSKGFRRADLFWSTGQ